MVATRFSVGAKAAVACALALAIAMPAAAQPSSKEAKQGRSVLADYSACVADAEPELARAFVIAGESDADRDEWKQLIDPRCMGFNNGKLRMMGFMFRGALAERLIKKTLAPDALANVGELAPINATFPGADPFAQNYTLMYRLGECIARTDASGARELLSTKMDSSREKKAIQELAPVISGCVPEGEPVRIDRVRLRYGLATMYYRLAARLAEKGGA